MVVFRQVNGKRTGAVFDVQQIRSGHALDPQIRSNDMIIVGYSGGKRTWREILNAMPLVHLFQPF